MGWNEDISDWATSAGRPASNVEEIAKNKGWEPSKYQPSMRSDLFDWLDKWHTLSVKTLPQPATKNRRNPQTLLGDYSYTELSNNWKIWTFEVTAGQYSTIAFNGARYIEYSNTTLSHAIDIHKNLILDLDVIHG